MKKTAITFLILLLTLSCNTTSSQDQNGNHLISKLEKAENTRDIDQINEVFHDNAVFYTTELMPIKQKSGILSIYEFVFSRNDVKNSNYQVDSTYNSKKQQIEYGKLTTTKVNQDITIQPFKAVFEKQKNSFKLIEISFGNESDLKKVLPKMLPPTGKFDISRRTYFYDKPDSGNERLLSFEIWYPTNTNLATKAPFRSSEVVTNTSRFMGIPNFMTSYFSEIRSHTALNQPAVPNKTFPVLMYNHGYGGFTQVYQTVFEDLVSHGYIVVSIGHENESALLIKEDGKVISTSPQNEFFTKRAPELTGSRIGRWQSEILNADALDTNENAYKEMLQRTPLHNESTRLWQSDTEMVLDKLKSIHSSDSILNGCFNFNKIGIFGHSLGGATAGQMSFGTTEIAAGINLDGFQFGDLFNHKLEVPFMFVSSNEEGNRYLRASTFIKNANQDCYQVSIKGFSHDNFTDLKYIIEGDSNAMQLQRNLVRIFFDKYLKNDAVDLFELEQRYSRISFDLSNIQKD